MKVCQIKVTLLLSNKIREDLKNYRGNFQIQRGIKKKFKYIPNILLHLWAYCPCSQIKPNTTTDKQHKSVNSADASNSLLARDCCTYARTCVYTVLTSEHIEQILKCEASSWKTVFEIVRYLTTFVELTINWDEYRLRRILQWKQRRMFSRDMTFDFRTGKSMAWTLLWLSSAPPGKCRYISQNRR